MFRMRSILAASAIALVLPFAASGSAAPRGTSISDPAGDANYLTPLDMSTPNSRPEADILEAGLKVEGKKIMAFWLLSASPAGQTITLQLSGNPSPDYPGPDARAVNSRCISVYVVFGLTENPYGHAGNLCDEIYYEGRVSLKETSDGTLLSIVFDPRRFPLKSGDSFIGPQAQSAEITDNPTGGFYAQPKIDTTEIGEDFQIP